MQSSPADEGGEPVLIDLKPVVGPVQAEIGVRGPVQTPGRANVRWVSREPRSDGRHPANRAQLSQRPECAWHQAWNSATFFSWASGVSANLVSPVSKLTVTK